VTSLCFSTLNLLQTSIKESWLSSPSTTTDITEQESETTIIASAQDEQTLGTKTAEESSPLLELPPELRNQIYRYVLVSKSTVHVGLGAFVESPLLMTFKQIRHEATSIFYKENTIEILIDNYDITKSIKWED
jgi:hypothetical protein